jgi:hypothetical protein
MTVSAIHDMTSSLTHGRNCPNHRACAMHEICIVSRCKMSVPRRQANRLLSDLQNADENFNKYSRAGLLDTNADEPVADTRCRPVSDTGVNQIIFQPPSAGGEIPL